MSAFPNSPKLLKDGIVLADQVSAILPACRGKFVDLAEQFNARHPLP
ncbi:MAG TPA: hypothetical protein VJ420_08680 [Candidatus Udaeobacter sp.]|nr:hypothetical protein [Candidatus Udaeobacter sp.]